MSNVSEIAGPRTTGPESIDKSISGDRQIVLVFQGGGALGAYQAGVYQALHEANIEPDWIIGTSIGAINAALIAGFLFRAAGGVYQGPIFLLGRLAQLVLEAAYEATMWAAVLNAQRSASNRVLLTSLGGGPSVIMKAGFIPPWSAPWR
jgi:Patatin-like phospholipase